MFLEVLMNNYKSLKKQLKFCIKTMNDSPSLFVVDSNKDFTRKRKHLFGSTLFNVLLLESGSLKDEMFKLFGYKLDTPTASSFVQARSKIRPDAFHTLFNMFNERTQRIKLHKGYRLLAVDGSVLPISSAIKDSKTTFYKANNSNKPFSAYHLNTSYDLLECTYDIVLQGNAVMNENGAFNEIVDRYDGPKAIFIADRGYESINSFVKVGMKNNKYLIRVSNNIKIKEKDRKYEYQLNYVRAFHIIRNYLKEKGGKNPPDIESLIAKEILPIRPNRQNERKVKAKSPVSFNYRYD